jgi:hypothetical protein
MCAAQSFIDNKREIERERDMLTFVPGNRSVSNLWFEQEVREVK